MCMCVWEREREKFFSLSVLSQDEEEVKIPMGGYPNIRDQWRRREQTFPSVSPIHPPQHNTERSGRDMQ